MANLVIKGCFYYNEKKDLVVMILHTSECWAVDSISYYPINKWKRKYNKSFRDENKDDFVLCNGKKYFYTGREVSYVDELELLTEIDSEKICYFDENREFYYS